MNSNDLRRKFLDFFKERGHAVISGASLIPENDPTTLFVGSGMQPLILYLLGKEHPLGNRLTNCQKSFRVADIEDVGDNRHTTLFEMLGNWSLGDYFKKEQLNWIFDFLTEELKINPERIYITTFRGNKKIGIEKDGESVEIWKEIFSRKDIKARDIDFSEKEGMQNGRIFYYDETKNWWSRSGSPDNMPLNEPGGPDSEVFYDLGEELKRHENSIWKNKPCHVNCDCGRFIEIGNSVFMEYIKTEKGFEKLPQKNVDFGGGLERITMVIQGKTNVFETDLFIGILNKIKELSGGKEYKDNVKAFEVIADHIKGAVFIISEDVLPSNTERGYILRRLLRRAIRYGKILKMPQNFLIPLGQEVIEIYKDVYPELLSKEADILTVIQNEEEVFEKALDQGLKEFNNFVLRREPKKGRVGAAWDQSILYGEDAFYLYQSFGFPKEIMQELCKEKNIKFDEEGFKKELEKHRQISRAGAEKKFGGVGKEAGYEIAKLHTATHLLHAALRKILGAHVKQMGSDITLQRLRFDFSHHQKMTESEIKKVEELVNQKIKEDLEIKKEEMPYQEAIKKGALALGKEDKSSFSPSFPFRGNSVFKEKYPEIVTVYSATELPKEAKVEKRTKFSSTGDFSKEICAGPHVNRTSELGHFKIIKEESSGSGVRRIRGVLESI